MAKPFIEDRHKDGRVLRVKWRFDGRQQSVAVESYKLGEQLINSLLRYPRPADDPTVQEFVGRVVREETRPEPVTVRQALEVTYTFAGLIENSRRAYRNGGQRWEPLHELYVHQLTEDDIARAWFSPRMQAYAESTRFFSAVVLKAALREHGRAALLAPYLEDKPDREREPVVMTMATMQLVAAVADDHRLGEVLRILLGTGVRIGEALALAKANGSYLDTDIPMLAVRKQFPTKETLTRDSRPITLKGKSKSRRSIPIGLGLADWISTRPPGWLLRHHDGGPQSYWRLGNWLRTLNKRIVAEGLVPEPVTFHDFRHSWGNHLLSGGTPLHTVSEWLGHASIETTVKAYGAVTEADRARARDLLK